MFFDGIRQFILNFVRKEFEYRRLRRLLFFGIFIFPGIILFLFSYWASLNEKKIIDLASLLEFVDVWGSLIGILLTIIVSFYIALLPSKVDHDIKSIKDKLQGNLRGFKKVYEEAEKLLQEVHDDKDSEFIMISASPLFGFELDGGENNKWNKLIKDRAEKKLRTTLICLDWNSENGMLKSPLFGFCEFLAAHENKDTRTTNHKYAIKLYAKCLNATNDMLYHLTSQSEESERGKFNFFIGDESPFQLVISKNKDNHQKCILYFSNSNSNREAGGVLGLYTEDAQWIKVLSNLIPHLASTRNEVPIYPISKQQYKRDGFFINKFSKILHNTREWKNDQLDTKKILIAPNVFPSDLGHSTGDLIFCLKNEITKLQNHTNVIGLDVGTGCGVVALALSDQCKHVYAIDSFKPAIENLKKNIDKNNISNITGVLGSYSYPINEELNKMDNSCTIFVICNYPYYPSSLNLFNNANSESGVIFLNSFFEGLSKIKKELEIFVIIPISGLVENMDNRTPLMLAKQNEFEYIEELPLLNKQSNEGNLIKFHRKPK